MFGLYPLAGSDRLMVGSPMFPQVKLTLANGKTLSIETHQFQADGTSFEANKVQVNGNAGEKQHFWGKFVN